MFEQQINELLQQSPKRRKLFDAETIYSYYPVIGLAVRFAQGKVDQIVVTQAAEADPRN
jgi:hypothetical protein